VLCVLPSETKNHNIIDTSALNFVAKHYLYSNRCRVDEHAKTVKTSTPVQKFHFYVCMVLYLMYNDSPHHSRAPTPISLSNNVTQLSFFMIFSLILYLFFIHLHYL